MQPIAFIIISILFVCSGLLIYFLFWTIKHDSEEFTDKSMQKFNELIDDNKQWLNNFEKK